jgi:hypothetical protein
MIFKTFFPFENYGISPCGQVINRKTGRFMKQTKNADGYMIVGLRHKGISKTFRVHRLVGHLYIPNPGNKPEVNHKDLDKQNNHKTNLEWCTGKENVAHAIRNGIKNNRPARSVHKVALPSRQILDTYKTVVEAASHNGLDFSNIYSVLRGRRSHCGGFHWEYA